MCQFGFCHFEMRTCSKTSFTKKYVVYSPHLQTHNTSFPSSQAPWWVCVSNPRLLPLSHSHTCSLKCAETWSSSLSLFGTSEAFCRVINRHGERSSPAVGPGASPRSLHLPLWSSDPPYSHTNPPPSFQPSTPHYMHKQICVHTKWTGYCKLPFRRETYFHMLYS